MSRPGADLVVADWKDTCVANGCNYLNTAGFVRVPTSCGDHCHASAGQLTCPEMVRGPGDFNMHTTLAKSFSLGAGTRLQVRADVFSVLNRKNYNNPNTNMNNADFGRITGAGGAGVSVRSKVDVLTHHWKIGRLADWQITFSALI